MADKKRTYVSDTVIIGGGLAGIVAAFDLIEKNKKVVLLERDEEERFGGLARESFGGVMMVDTPMQRRMGIRDSPELALSDWNSFANFDEQDVWPRKWAETYASESETIYKWLKKRSVKFLPLVNWPERGLFLPGNSVPRLHIAWGTGSGMMESVLKHLNRHKNRKNLRIQFGHKVEGIVRKVGAIEGCAGTVEKTGEEFLARADVVVAASGGICGGDLSLVRKHWNKDWGEPPKNMLNGSHRYADGALHGVVEQLGGSITHLDRHWHCAAGIHHPKPDRHMHGLSLVPPRGALWVNAFGERIGPIPLVGQTDTRYVVEQILKQPGQYSWQIMNRKIAEKELAVSGSDYMTAFRNRDRIRLLKNLLFGDRELVDSLSKDSKDIVTAYNLDVLVDKMNRLDSPCKVDFKTLESEINAYDEQIDSGYCNDDQLRRIANSRNYVWDRLRTCKHQKIDDIRTLPLIAIREFILTRKSLGGIRTDLKCRVLSKEGEPIPGLYAVGEAAGFGGGGIHGKGSLDGTFLGSCVLTGTMAAKAIAG